jgi:hypothetical protein
MAVNWVIKLLGEGLRKEHLYDGKQRQQTVKSHLKQYDLLRNSSKKKKKKKKGGTTKAPSAIHGPLDPIFYPTDKVNINADHLENQSKSHNLCD